MSTFNGRIAEFPLISVDYFRHDPSGQFKPNVGFVSHVHTDHTVGLDRFAGTFIYCSPATREILLKLQSSYVRLNKARGILETGKCHFQHLASRLRPIPLDIPTMIEVVDEGGRKENIRVTLLDANHCIGAVMFLFEGNGKAVLYTGDIRAEHWWTEKLIRHPLIIPYTRGIRRLDRLYLDTTFANFSLEHRKFPSKADGIADLLAQVARYPPNTCFYFHYWTFGYEDVWVALSNFLQCKIHVDAYRHDLFTGSAKSRTDVSAVRDFATLRGFTLGNGQSEGILTRGESTRLHSCERGGALCDIWTNGRHIVEIIPVVSEFAGMPVEELGVGGGLFDMKRGFALDLNDPTQLQTMLDGFTEWEPDAELVQCLKERIQQNILAGNKILRLDSPQMDRGTYPDMEHFFEALEKYARLPNAQSGTARDTDIAQRDSPSSQLPEKIHFSYARHSSYEELRHLVRVLNPLDVYPCTEVPNEEWDCRTTSIEILFGDDFEVGPEGYQRDRQRPATSPAKKSPRFSRQKQNVKETRKQHGNLYGVASHRSSSRFRTAKSSEERVVHDQKCPKMTSGVSPNFRITKQCITQESKDRDGDKLAMRQSAFNDALRGRWTSLSTCLDSTGEVRKK